MQVDLTLVTRISTNLEELAGGGSFNESSELEKAMDDGTVVPGAADRDRGRRGGGRVEGV